MDNTQVQNLLMQALGGTGTAPVKESNFDNTQLYANDNYIGNFSIPKDFSAETVGAIETFMASKGIEIRREKKARQTLSLTDLTGENA